ncbi:hypothetical protein N5J77_30030 [Sphingobium yanoikuyae]|uniref:Uncharacterized protein n=1 Tax=Sphingobium yanoikuyae TaxID=13690 RepID=A0AA43BBC9_SPHYA|nr:hypothetical protein [Sphingobium yanoikuyae]MDH2135361.1 hypothetical protein [Sphingobium yanoikuyae]MDH2153627.1 hypothetical protein [Sphingobium yanoikuyae]MDH2170712.1 hypothetical protein [Sphingobium yanoikuyae]
MIYSAIAMMLATTGLSDGTFPIPADGKKHKVTYNDETFKIRITGNKISILHIPTLMGRKRGPIVRDWNREVARAATGCELRDEYMDPMSLALDAILVCPAVKDSGL